MRRLFVAGNWKMNTNAREAEALASALVRSIGGIEEVDLAVCPPFPYLSVVGRLLGASRIQLGAQNMYFEPEGAYTGEVSGAMLCDVGCRLVILGHSERRHVLGEPDELVSKKVHAALAAGLTPIVCVGEVLAERESGRTQQVLQTQLAGSLAGLSAAQAGRIVVAYEPVWAIGTGKTATPDMAEQAHQFIRERLAAQWDSATAEAIRIQYGGSVKPDNAHGLLAEPNIDGALVGGASLKGDSFAAIVTAGCEAAKG